MDEYGVDDANIDKFKALANGLEDMLVTYITVRPYILFTNNEINERRSAIQTDIVATRESKEELLNERNLQEI